jgi:hypothetical protein
MQKALMTTMLTTILTATGCTASTDAGNDMAPPPIHARAPAGRTEPPPRPAVGVTPCQVTEDMAVCVDPFPDPPTGIVEDDCPIEDELR